VVSWWHAVHRKQPPVEWNTYKRNVARGLKTANRVIAPTRAFLEQLQSCYGFTQPAEIIRNGRPRNSFSAPAAPSGGREPILLGCGRLWDAAKNLSIFDAAAEGLSWPAYVIGDTAGPDGQTFVSRALRPLGPLSRDHVESWQQRASIFVHPALYEPFGLAVLEAANAGCALVLADIPTLRELWDGAAEFFNPCDSAQLHAALNVLIADPAKRNALAAAAQRRAAEYCVESMATAYAKVYRSLAASPTSQSSGARAVA
jgi:glycosyltransferase involved in cell wall biosynthesis